MFCFCYDEARQVHGRNAFIYTPSGYGLDPSSLSAGYDDFQTEFARSTKDCRTFLLSCSIKINILIISTFTTYLFWLC